ncbi:hypothetical protein LIER_19942 [Lithospermum erythrorhizon]|uniref:Uncharacterized protein n=1 Tax=Lithospermum erythrorhizon TaxID=34254 RepID=A0AAV3QMB8_LITER
MVGREAVEVAKTVLEVADVAWSAVERCHHQTTASELSSLRSENERLRNLLEQNLQLLQNISVSPALLPNFPPDLHQKLISCVESQGFLDSISTNNNIPSFPFKDPQATDLEAVEILINVDQEEPSWWVWVTDDMAPSNIEEQSGIDNQSYVVVSEEHVLEGLANFVARCILSCPKSKDMSPQELQTTLSKALGGMNKVEKMISIWHAGKMFYTLSTWGLALTGLYRSRAILKLAAVGLHSTSKVVMRAL